MAVVRNNKRDTISFASDESLIKVLQNHIGASDNKPDRAAMYCLEIINQLTENGTQISQRIPQEVFSGLSKGRRRNVAASALCRANDFAVPGKQEEDGLTSSGYTREQEVIGQWAERDGCWSDTPDGDLARRGYKHDTEVDGSEAHVFMDKAGQSVYKTIDHIRYPNLERLLDRITIHNALFPETAMEVVGFGIRDYADDNSGFCITIRQKFVQGTSPEIDDIDDSMTERGLTPKAGGFYWTTPSGEVLVTDLHEDNCVLDSHGRVIVFDCEAVIRDEEQMDGPYRIPPLQYDEKTVKEIETYLKAVLPKEMSRQDALSLLSTKESAQAWNELQIYGRTVTPVTDRTTGEKLVIQFSPEDDGTVLVSNVKAIKRMLCDFRKEDYITDEGVRLSREQMEQICSGRTASCGASLCYHYDLDKGRIDILPNGMALTLKPKVNAIAL